MHRKIVNKLPRHTPSHLIVTHITTLSYLNDKYLPSYQHISTRKYIPKTMRPKAIMTVVCYVCFVKIRVLTLHFTKREMLMVMRKMKTYFVNLMLISLYLYPTCTTWVNSFKCSCLLCVHRKKLTRLSRQVYNDFCKNVGNKSITNMYLFVSLEYS